VSAGYQAPAASTAGRGEYRGRRGPPAPSPSRATILRKVPEGSDRVTGTSIERVCLDDLVTDPRWRACRPARRQHLVYVVKWLARTADYASGTTRCTRLLVCQLGAMSVRTWQRCRAQLQAWGRLGVVRAGMCLAEYPEANEAAVYVLCVPRKTRPRQANAQLIPQTDPPTGEGNPDRPVHPHDPGPDQGQKRSGAPPGRPVSPAVARAVRIGPAKNLSDRAVAAITRPFRAAGWPPAALSWAVDHERDGTWHFRSLREVRRPAGWLRWRLSRHLGPGGVPLASSLALARAAYEQSPPPGQLCARCGRPGHDKAGCPH
jgi:hypothetical protein